MDDIQVYHFHTQIIVNDDILLIYTNSEYLVIHII